MVFVPIPAELYEHVGSEVDGTVALSVVAGMESRRNVHQFHKFEQMAENTFREPFGVYTEVKIKEKSDKEIDDCSTHTWHCDMCGGGG